MKNIRQPIHDFFVEGIPRPGGSKKAFAIKKNGRYTGKTIVTDAGKHTKKWREIITHAICFLVLLTLAILVLYYDM